MCLLVPVQSSRQTRARPKRMGIWSQKLMAMSKAIRKELSKLRELAWHLLEDEKCYFCGKPLLPKTKIEFGNGVAQPIPLELLPTIHHEKIVFKAYNNGMTVAEARRNRVVGSLVLKGRAA